MQALVRGWASGSHPPPPPLEVLCPLATEHPRPAGEPANADDIVEIRAYKLGKKRWSYNQCALTLQQRGGFKTLTVAEAMSNGHQSLPDDQQESGVAYSVRLNNGERVRVVVYVVSDDPKAVVVPGAPIEQRYQWNSVTRAHCKKGCSGPILRAIQRFGRQGRRSGGPGSPGESNSPPKTRGRSGARGRIGKAKVSKASREGSEDLKDARFLYLSIDEAGTHVGMRHFRLLVGVYSHDGAQLLGTGLSGPVRVLANNDVPTGAAYINLDVPILHDWDGWSKAERAARPPSARAAVRGGPSGSPNAHASPREHTRSQSSSETSHPAGHPLLESPELRSRDGAQLLMGSPAAQHSAMLFDLQQHGHSVGLPPPPPGMGSISPGLRMLGGGLSGGEGSSDGGGGLSGGGLLSGMGPMGGGGPFGGDRAMSSMDYSALHDPRAGAAMLHGFGNGGPAHGGGSGAGGGPLAMRMLSGSGMQGTGVGAAVHHMLGHPDSVLGSSSGLDSRLGSAPSSFMVSGGSVVGGGTSNLVVHSGGFSAAGAVGGSWRYSADGQSQAQGFLSNIASGDPGMGGFSIPTISTQPQSSPSISDSVNCRWGYSDHGMVNCTQTVSPNVHSSMPGLQQQQMQQQQLQQQQQQQQQAVQQQQQASRHHMMADMRQRSSIGTAPLGIHRTKSEPVVNADNMMGVMSPFAGGGVAAHAGPSPPQHHHPQQHQHHQMDQGHRGLQQQHQPQQSDAHRLQHYRSLPGPSELSPIDPGSGGGGMHLHQSPGSPNFASSRSLPGLHDFSDDAHHPMMADLHDFAQHVGLHSMDMSSPALPMPQLNRGQMAPGAEQWLLPDPGLLPLHVSPRLSSADVTAGLLVPTDSPLGSVGGSRPLPSSAGGSAGNGVSSFFAQSMQLPGRGGGGMQHDDVAHMLTEPSGIGEQVFDEDKFMSDDKFSTHM